MTLLLNNISKVFNNSLCTLNSKEVNKKTVFFAVKGKNTDGHLFVPEAIKKNCKFVVVKRGYKNLGKKKEKKFIRCKSPLKYLENVATYKRNQSKGIFFGITGSFGKTTLKFMLSFLLSKVKKTYSSPKSFNNHFGLPLSLSNLPANSIYNIFELGMNNKGEIHNLSKILQPDIGVITNIGPAHLEKLKNIKNIALCKSEIINNIKKNGTIFLNIDDKYFHLLKKKSKKNKLKILTFGKSNKANFQLIKKIILKNKKYILVKIINKNYKFKVKNFNDSFIMNFLIVISIFSYLKINKKILIKYINKFPTPSGRGSFVKKIINNQEVKILDESYNANPISMKNAVMNFSLLKINKKKVAILGDMLELGKMTKKFHKNLARELNSSNIDTIHCVGKKIKDTFSHLNLRKKGQYFKDINQLKKNKKNIFKNNSIYLLKSSNSVGLNQFLKEC